MMKLKMGMSSVPMGSVCAMGLSVTRPRRYAVSSPNLWDIHACAGLVRGDGQQQDDDVDDELSDEVSWHWHTPAKRRSRAKSEKVARELGSNGFRGQSDGANTDGYLTSVPFTPSGRL